MADRKKYGASSSKTSQSEEKHHATPDEKEVEKNFYEKIKKRAANSEEEEQRKMEAKRIKVVRNKVHLHQEIPTTSSNSNPSKRLKTANNDKPRPDDETNQENEVPCEKRKVLSCLEQAKAIFQCSTNRNSPISDISRKEEQVKSHYHNSDDEESPDEDLFESVMNYKVKNSSQLTKKEPESSSSFCPACGAKNKQDSEKLCSACKEFSQRITKENIRKLNCLKNESCKVNSDERPRKCLFCRYRRCLKYGILGYSELRPTIRTTKTNETTEKNKSLMKPRESFKTQGVIPTLSNEEKSKRHNGSHAQQLEKFKNSQNVENELTSEDLKTIDQIVQIYKNNPRYGRHSENLIPKKYVIETHNNETITRVEAWKNYSLELEEDIKAALPLICVFKDGLCTFDKTILFKESAFLIHLIRWNCALEPSGLLLPDGRLISLESLKLLYGRELLHLLNKFNLRMREWSFSQSDLAMFATHVLYRRIPDEVQCSLTNRDSHINAQLDFAYLFHKYTKIHKSSKMNDIVVEGLLSQLEEIQEQFWKMIEFLKPYEHIFPKNTSFETFYGIRPLFRSTKKQTEASTRRYFN